MTYQSTYQQSNKTTRQSIVYRYLRPFFFDASKKELIQSSSGGIAFRFALDHTLNIVSFTFCRCRETQRFCHNSARLELNQKAKTGKNFLIITPDASISLIDNVMNFCRRSEQKQLKQLAQHIKQVQKTNLNARAKEAEFYQTVTQVVKERYYGT